MTTPESTDSPHAVGSGTRIAGLRSALGEIMAPDVADMHLETSGELAAVRTHLAVDRSLMAADRTLMAWVRTSLSLFSFGFTIYKVLEGFQASGATLPDASPRTVGLFLSAMGTVAMTMGTIEYWRTLAELRKIEKFRIVRAPLIMAVLMSIIGGVLYFSISLKLF